MRLAQKKSLNLSFRAALRRHTSSPMLSRLRGDKRGVAALEFALIAPMLITLYLGLAEISIALSVDRKVSHAASVAADMATQVSELNATNAAELFVAALEVSEVKDKGNFTLHLESFTRDDDGNVISLGAVWYNGDNLETLESADTDAFDETLISGSAGLVVARVAYEYKPLGYSRVQHRAKTSSDGASIEKGRNFLNNTITLSETIMFTPRESQSLIIDSGDNDGFSCDSSGDSVNCTAADDPSGGGNGAADDECVSNANPNANGNANGGCGNNGNGNGN